MASRIARWFSAAFTAVLAVVLAGNLYLIIVSRVTGDLSPTIFGWGNAVVVSGSMEPTIRVDDMVVFHAQKDYEVGDVIVFESGSSLVTHRIIEKLPQGWLTQGDYNNAPDTDPVFREAIVGKVVFVIPQVGAVIAFLRTPFGMLILLLCGLAVWKWRQMKEFFRKDQLEKEGDIDEKEQ